VNHCMMGGRVLGEFETAINGQHCGIYGET
jgi:hypothetical protein